MKKVILIIWIITIPVCSQQKTVKDSLKELLTAQRDTFRLRTLYNLFTSYVRNSPDSAKTYLNTLLHESKTSKHKEFLGLAFKAEGLYYYYKSNYRQAKTSYSKSIAIYDSLSLSIPLSRMFNNQGIVLKYLGELEESKRFHLKSLKINLHLDQYHSLKE